MPTFHLPNLASKEIIPGFHGRMIHTDRMTLAYWKVEEGARLPEHHHPHEQVTQVIEGSFRMTVGSESRVLEPGDVWVIPSDVPHSGEALSNCQLMDVFQPAREAYR